MMIIKMKITLLIYKSLNSIYLKITKVNYHHRISYINLIKSGCTVTCVQINLYYIIVVGLLVVIVC